MYKNERGIKKAGKTRPMAKRLSGPVCGLKVSSIYMTYSVGRFFKLVLSVTACP